MKFAVGVGNSDPDNLELAELVEETEDFLAECVLTGLKKCVGDCCCGVFGTLGDGEGDEGDCFGDDIEDNLLGSGTGLLPLDCDLISC